MTQQIHEITRDDLGNQIGTDGNITVSLIGEGRMFKRRAVKGAGSENAQEVCWLVAEIDGVRLYQNGNQIILTRQDMNP
jgi:hypothetical protein